MADAQGLVNPVVEVHIVIRVIPQTIFYASVSTTTGCIATGSFDLVINPLPSLVFPTDLEVCDDGVPDGLNEYRFIDKESVEITGGNPNYSVSYYLTQSDADNAVNAFANTLHKYR